MTSTERSARHYARLRRSINRKRRAAYRLAHKSAATKAKQERRAEREREFAETIGRANERRGSPLPVPLADGREIVGWVGGLPIIRTPPR
jgi:hypothetical protein